MKRSVYGLLLLASVAISGCTNTAPSVTDSTTPGVSLFEDLDEDGRETVLIEPTEDGMESFDVRPAVFDTAMIRVDSNRPDGTATVEVLLKGSFPDACFQLHDLDQQPTNGGQNVVLSMRRPTDAICAQVVRPYRFFFTLDRRFAPGSHVLIVNEHPFSFEVVKPGMP